MHKGSTQMHTETVERQCFETPVMMLVIRFVFHCSLHNYGYHFKTVQVKDRCVLVQTWIQLMPLD